MRRAGGAAIVHSESNRLDVGIDSYWRVLGRVMHCDLTVLGSVGRRTTLCGKLL